jgi:hypothetical protein
MQLGQISEYPDCSLSRQIGRIVCQIRTLPLLILSGSLVSNVTIQHYNVFVDESVVK